MTKGLEAWKLYQACVEQQCNDYGAKEIIEKELKALEIIKKYFYGNGVLFGEMTPEELHFIREVLNS